MRIVVQHKGFFFREVWSCCGVHSIQSVEPRHERSCGVRLSDVCKCTCSTVVVEVVIFHVVVFK